MKAIYRIIFAIAATAMIISASAMAQDVEIVNSYDNTEELIQKFPVNNPTPVLEGIGEKIQNRLLTGFENWNRGFDAWKAWGNILYTEDSIYNVHGARLTLAEYQAAMDVTLKRTNILMGDFRNMIICDNWAAIQYEISTQAGDIYVPGSVMEFVKFADYGDELGVRVVEGWGGPKDSSFEGMSYFQSEEEKQAQQEAFAALLTYKIPEIDDLYEKYPVLYPTTDNSDMAKAIREAIFTDFDSWNQGYEVWVDAVDSFYTEDAQIILKDGSEVNLEEYKALVLEQAESQSVTKMYFDSILISADWAAIHFRTVTTDLSTGEKEPGDSMQFFHFIQNGDSVIVDKSWTS